MSSRNEMGGLKRLVLGGAVASLSMLGGCDTPRQFGLGAGLFGLGYLYQKGREINTAEENSKRESEAIKEAARIQADAVRGQNGSSGNAGDVQRERDYNNQVPRIIYFTCSRVIDLNNDGINDIGENSNEVMDRGKTEFYIGDDYLYVAKFYNCKGRNVQMFNQSGPNREFQGSNVHKIQNDFYLILVGGKLKEVASWHAYITMDDIKIADFRINVKEDPARPISKSKK